MEEKDETATGTPGDGRWPRTMDAGDRPEILYIPSTIAGYLNRVRCTKDSMPKNSIYCQSSSPVLDFRKHKQLFFRLSPTAPAAAPQPAASLHPLPPWHIAVATTTTTPRPTKRLSSPRARHQSPSAGIIMHQVPRLRFAVKDLPGHNHRRDSCHGRSYRLLYPSPPTKQVAGSRLAIAAPSEEQLLHLPSKLPIREIANAGDVCRSSIRSKVVLPEHEQSPHCGESYLCLSYDRASPYLLSGQDVSHVSRHCGRGSDYSDAWPEAHGCWAWTPDAAAGWQASVDLGMGKWHRGRLGEGEGKKEAEVGKLCK